MAIPVKNWSHTLDIDIDLNLIKIIDLVKKFKFQIAITKLIILLPGYKLAHNDHRGPAYTLLVNYQA